MITVGWDDEAHTIVHLVAEGSWNLAEFRDACYTAMALIRTVSYPVYVLSDFRRTSSYPTGLLWQLRDLNQMRPANWAGGIAVAQDNFVTTLVATLSQVYMERNKHRLFVVKTEAEAYEVIARLKQHDLLNRHDQ